MRSHASPNSVVTSVEALTERERHERRQAWVYFGVLAVAIAIVIAALVFALVG